MNDILTPSAKAVIESFGADEALLVFDFDGTLAPIVQDRDAARMRDETRALFAHVSELYPCAIVSGRSRADVTGRVEGIRLTAIVGNHGAEPDARGPEASTRARVRSWAAALRDALSHHEGVDVEEKGYGVAVHYREAADHARAQRRVLALASALPGARVFGGSAVVNVSPVGAPTKGAAVEGLARAHPGRPIVFTGDDDTDEDAFRSPAVTAAVRVGRSAHSAARWFVASQERVDEWLRRLVSARQSALRAGGAQRR